MNVRETGRLQTPTLAEGDLVTVPEEDPAARSGVAAVSTRRTPRQDSCSLEEASCYRRLIWRGVSDVPRTVSG